MTVDGLTDTYSIRLDCISLLPLHCGEYGGDIRTRQQLCDMAFIKGSRNKLTHEAAGKLLAGFAIHVLNVPRNTKRSSTHCTLVAIEWHHPADAAKPDLILVRQRGFRTTFMIAQKEYARTYDPVTGRAVHIVGERIATGGTRTLLQPLGELIDLAHRIKPIAAAAFPAVSRHAFGSLPMRVATFATVLRMASDRLHGLQYVGKEVADFWLRQPQLPPKATILSMVCSGARLEQSSGNLVPVKNIWRAETRPKDKVVGYAWLSGQTADFSGHRAPKRRKQSTSDSRVGMLSADITDVLGCPLGKWLCSAGGCEKCIVTKGRVHILSESIGFFADSTNMLGVAQLLNVILDALSRDPRLTDMLLEIDADAKAKPAPPVQKGAVADEPDATTTYLRKLRAAGATRKQAHTLEISVGRLSLKNAPPCVLQCVDPGRPFKNDSRFQLASVVATMCSSASEASKAALVETLKDVVTAPANPNKHRWKSFEADLRNQLKKKSINYPCVKRKYKRGYEGFTIDALIQKNVDPGLLCPFGDTYDNVGTCLGCRSIPANLEKLPRSEWTPQLVWGGTDQIVPSSSKDSTHPK